MTIVLKVLIDCHKSDSLPSFHYNNMVEELQNIAPEITEETLLQLNANLPTSLRHIFIFLYFIKKTFMDVET